MIDRQARHLQEEATLNAVIEAFDDRVHLDGIRWFSRDPDTGTWDNDRMWGRRLAILSDLHWSGQGTERRTWPAWRALEDRPGQYSFLARNAHHFRKLPRPADLRP